MSDRATERFIAWPHSWLDKTHPLWAKRKTHPRWISAFLLMNHRAAYKGFTYKPKRAKEGVYLGRGEFVMSYSLLAEETGMSEYQARYFLRFCHTHNHVLKKVKRHTRRNRVSHCRFWSYRQLGADLSHHGRGKSHTPSHTQSHTRRRTVLRRGEKNRF